MDAVARVPARMTVTEFLAWSSETPGRWELVDGEPRAMAPPSRTHGAIQSEVSGLIRAHLIETGSPCSVITGPGVVPRVQAAHNMRVPDLAVTCSGYTAEEAALAAPVLMIEILSPSNEADTWANVWTYTSIPSVREIVVVHSVAIGAEMLSRGVDGMWPSSPEALDAGAELVLASIGMTVRLAAVYRTTRLAPEAGAG